MEGDFIMSPKELAWFERKFGVKADDIFIIVGKHTNGKEYAYKKEVPIEFRKRVHQAIGVEYPIYDRDLDDPEVTMILVSLIGQYRPEWSR